jgi:ATP-dependent RNA helicase RhlE
VTDFTTLGLAEPILKALAAEGYSNPTPIQSQAIPIVLDKRDLIGLAQTGTGKTAAFALPILHRLAADRRHAGARACRVLVLAPTRELAAQIGQSFRTYGKFLGLSTAIVYGGASMHKQKQALNRGVDILVATPGRLLDHISQRSARLDGIEILVLDEADHMLDMGFIHDLRRIAKLVPEKRQTLLFSATMPGPIAELAAQFLTDPVRVAVAAVSSTTERVEQAVIHVAQAGKGELLMSLLQEPAITRGLVFCRTKHGANRLAEKLADAGHSVDAIHGNKSQGQRERALKAFKDGKARLLVATEIAARGIDVDDVSHVINFDLPNVPEQYVHRVGRTARAGAGGSAISFCAPDERSYLRDIERLTKQSVPVREHPLALATPREGERVPRKPAGNNQNQKRNFNRPRYKKPGEAGQRDGQRDGQREGQREQREGHSEWKRSAKPPQRNNSGANSGNRQQRDDGDRRDRKGHDVWSNGPPRRADAKRRPRQA